MTSLSFLRDTALLKGHSVLVLAENMTYFGSLRDTTLLTGHSVLVQTAALVLATVREEPLTASRTLKAAPNHQFPSRKALS